MAEMEEVMNRICASVERVYDGEEEEEGRRRRARVCDSLVNKDQMHLTVLFILGPRPIILNEIFWVEFLLF